MQQLRTTDYGRREQLIYFLKRRQRCSRSNSAALQTRDSVCESQSLFNGKTREQTVHKAPVKGISRTRSVPALNSESGRVDVLALEVCEYSVTSQRRRDKQRTGHLLQLLQRGAKIGFFGHSERKAC